MLIQSTTTWVVSEIGIVISRASQCAVAVMSDRVSDGPRVTSLSRRDRSLATRSGPLQPAITGSLQNRATTTKKKIERKRRGGTAPTRQPKQGKLG